VARVMLIGTANGGPETPPNQPPLSPRKIWAVLMGGLYC
jgi:hypothetical protein